MTPDSSPSIARAPVYEQQRQFIEDTHHFSAFIGGIGSGKTWSGAIKALEFALAKPSVGMVTAPVYGTLRDATIPVFREVAEGYIESITTTAPINATLSNGSKIYFRSAHNPELLRGPSISWWWGDEAALYSRNVWRVMIGRLRQGGRLGYAWLSTTPKGRNWIYTEFIQNSRDKYAIFKARTADNTFIDPDYYAMLAESYTGDFARQELDGDFVAFEGLIYATFDRELHMPQTPKTPSVFNFTVAGVDWGYANPGVIVVYGVDGDGRMWGLHEEYVRRRRIEEWATLAAQLRARFDVQTFYCDPSEPDFISQFQAAGCNAIPANNAVLPGVQSVQNRLVRQGDGLPRLILSPEFVNTAAEFEQYQWMENRDGIRDQPKKANDHALDATRYAAMGVDEQMNTQPLSVAIKKVL